MLGRLLKLAGYNVSTEYYINDVGNQMNTLGRSTWARYREILGIAEEFSQDYYQGEYIRDIAQELLTSGARSFWISRKRRFFLFSGNIRLIQF